MHICPTDETSLTGAETRRNRFKRVTAGLLRRLDVRSYRLGVEAHLRLADQVETAGNQDEVFSGDGALCKGQGLAQARRRLAHLAAYLGVHIGQLLRRRRLRRVAPCKDDLVGAVLQVLEDPPDVLIAVTPENHNHRIIGDVLPHRVDQGLHTRGVVGGVDHNPRIIANHFHPTGQRHLTEPFHCLAVVYLVAARLELIQHGKGQPAVDRLMFAVKRHAKVLEFARGRCQADPRVRTLLTRRLKSMRKVYVDACYAQGGLDRLGLRFENAHRDRVLLNRYSRHTTLENPGLFLCNTVDCLAKLGLVVDAQAGYTDNFGLYNVCAVQSAAKTRLYHADIDFRIRKMKKSQRGHYLKKRRRIVLGHLFQRSMNPVQQVVHLLFADHLRVHRYPLVEVHKVRRGVQPHFVPVRLEHLGQHGRRRAFTFCAGYMGCMDFSVGVAQQRKQFLHPLEAECGDVVPQMLLFFVVRLRKKVADGLFVAPEGLLAPKLDCLGGGGFLGSFLSCCP